MIDEEFKNDPNLDPSVYLPDDPLRLADDVDWHDVETCKTFMADPEPADGTFDTMVQTASIAEYAGTFTIPR